MAPKDWFTITDRIRTYKDGTKEYLNEAGELHREDRMGKSANEKAILLLKYGTGRGSTMISE